jgi:GT2 family glycosyltransferase
MNGVGIGVVTYNRIDYFKKCIVSIPIADRMIVVNDGTPYPDDTYPSKVTKLIQHTENKCVGASKNEAMRYLVDEGCGHIFIIEDDMEILKSDVFDMYVRAQEISGIKHFNYGPGSPWNRKDRKKDGPPAPRMTIDYGGVKVSLYRHTVAMFSYFTRDVLLAVGYHDENLRNAWEHVDLTSRIISAGHHPPFWWFADIAGSNEYMREQDDAIENSTILKDKDKWLKNVEDGVQYYMKKYGRHPAQYPESKPEDVVASLKKIKGDVKR